jgi:thiamine-monophosphate kinase
MGAEPAWLTLALTLPEADEAWLEAFSDSLFVQLNYYDMQLIGGDTTRGPLSMTLGIHGYVPTGRALKRSGAKPATGFTSPARRETAPRVWRFCRIGCR